MGVGGVTRVAMWSGPRNISTAMLRSWGSRDDTVVCDEPLYAHYLQRTKLPHPGADEVMRHHECDWRVVVEQLLAPLPPGKTVFYQKHMAHHLLPDIERTWLDRLSHAFLIRDPAEMLTSYIEQIPDPTLDDTGLAQQWEIFERVAERTGTAPPVLDARDVLEDPPRMLGTLCGRLDLPFDRAMLSWAPGPRPTDGIWAKHWYAGVESSTGFRPYRPKRAAVPERLAALHVTCMEYYGRLHQHRI